MDDASPKLKSSAPRESFDISLKPNLYQCLFYRMHEAEGWLSGMVNAISGLSSSNMLFIRHFIVTRDGRNGASSYHKLFLMDSIILF